MKKIITVAAAVVASLTLAACGSEPDVASCNDVRTLEQAVANIRVEKGEVKEEIIDDLREAGAENNCPGYDDGDDD